MDKFNKEKNNHDTENMSDQKPGSALYTKSHEDFNNEHPEHDENGLINSNVSPVEKDKGNENKQASETKSEKKEPAITYTCSMHPEVISDKPGKCPKCGMELVEKK